MTHSRDAVASGADLAALLARLAAALGPDAPAVDDFLLRWAALLPGLPAAAPGWPGLAAQVQAALAAPPTGGAVPAADGPADEPDVCGPDDLAALLEVLAADFARHRTATATATAATTERPGAARQPADSWAHHTLPDVLESWAAWLTASPGRPQPLGLPPVEPVTWASVAVQVLAARGGFRRPPA
ncbi:hypothetical protein KNE206_47460 [Kitasatospora sp. NE20-6]|uniref:hypothetical protein n=1 Tax=Kitasatospora sp. NE20-6 TaxID=2859066 RepID=UPI0034DC6AD7